ncbi:MAG: hypothetical protein ACXWJM_11055 [Ramlibacter sp.]
MNSPGREEIDAKLQTVEIRLDGRVAAIQATIEGLVRRIDELSQRTVRLEAAIESLRSTMLVTAVSSVVAIVLGVAAFNSSLSSNMLAPLKAGGDLSAERAEVKRQTEETDALLRRLQAQLPPASPARQPSTQQPNQ